MNSWCESCAKKNQCYTVDIRPKCFVPITSNDRIKDIPSVESNLILPERVERGECYEVGETIVVMNHDDYYDLLCKAMENEPKQGEWIDKGWHGDWQFEIDGRGNCWKAFECSNCNTTSKAQTNFCPNCGAYMKKGTDDGTH